MRLHSQESSQLLERTVKNMMTNSAKLKNAPFAVDERVLRRIAGLN